MTTTNHHDHDIFSFIEDMSAPNKKGDGLKLEFVQNISHGNIDTMYQCMSCSRRVRTKLRNYLHDNEVECGKSSNAPISTNLKELLPLTRDQRMENRKQNEPASQPTSMFTDERQKQTAI